MESKASILWFLLLVLLFVLRFIYFDRCRCRSLSLLYNIPLYDCATIYLSILLLRNIWIGSGLRPCTCFSMTILAHISKNSSAGIPLIYAPNGKLLGYVMHICSTFKRICLIVFLKGFNNFLLLPVVNENSFCKASLPGIHIVRFRFFFTFIEVHSGILLRI